MANKKISDLPAAAVATNNDQLETNQGGVSKRLIATQILDLLTAGYPLGGLQVNGGDLGVGGGGNLTVGVSLTLLADGSAVFAAAGDQMTIEADGLVRIGGVGLGAKYIFNRDGTGLISSETFTITNTLTASTLASTGDISAVGQYQAGGQNGLTNDFVILVGGIPKTFHFQGGILTNVT
jgi:hypothetical protein